MTQDTVLGLDVGGSSVKYRLAPALATDDAPIAMLDGTAATPLEDPVDGLADLALQLAEGTRLRAVAVAIPGLVDEQGGTVLRAANIPSLDGVDLGPRLAERLGVPVRILNDGRAAAVAEARWGAGSGFADVFTLTLGTGIAGCHVINGVVADGAHGVAGELGHIVVDPNGAACGCGQRGCLETVIGAPALERAWHGAGGTGTPHDLLIAAYAGDEHATAIIGHAAAALASALLTLLALVDPGAVIIGGGLASSPHMLVNLAIDEVARSRTFHRVPPIIPAQLGRWAGAVGCAAEARHTAGMPAPTA